jgi:small subunit ribosomal protein S1
VTEKIAEEKTKKETVYKKKNDKKGRLLGDPPERRESPNAKILAQIKAPLAVGDLAVGTVIAADRGRVYIDLPPFGTGIIYGKEYLAAREILKKVSVGDSVTAKVVETDSKHGYIELSLKEARQAMLWSDAEEAVRAKTPFDLVVLEANKGGLIMEWQGIQGFLPASQLGANHYPRVEDGDKDRILEELKKMIGQKVTVAIISVLSKEGKLIFSEKALTEKDRAQMVGKYSVGDELDGTVTGAVDFGIFVKIEDGLEGLVHISEMDWALVENPRLRYKTGEQVKVKIIDIKDGKVSLSIKALKPNPWMHAEKTYHKGDAVHAVIIKYNKYGALASIEEGVAGLVHISDFAGDESKLRATLELGKSYSFTITLFEPKEQRMTLSYAGEKK